jgi:hypothetical protein
MVHPDSFVYQPSWNETRVVDARSRSIQQCLYQLFMSIFSVVGYTQELTRRNRRWK